MAWVLLGLSDDAFYRLTPRQFHLLIDQHRERVEHQELLAGIIASSIVNWSMGAPKKPATPSDFMPSHVGLAQQQQAAAPRINRKRIADKVRKFFESNPHG